MIRVRDVLTNETVEFDDRYVVEFDVEPPISKLSPDHGGGAMRLRDTEGRITFRPRDGGVEVSGRHAVDVQPSGANGMLIRLRESREVAVTR